MFEPEVREMLQSENGELGALGLVLIILSYLPAERRAICLERASTLIKVL
jgi:hypothetical protein